MTNRDRLAGLLTGDKEAVAEALKSKPPVHAVLFVAAPDDYEAKDDDPVSIYGTGERMTVSEWRSLNEYAISTPILSTLGIEGATFVSPFVPNHKTDE